MVTQKRLMEILSYDPDSGVFTWNVRVGNKRPRDIAGDSHHKDGYIRIGIDGGRYLAHRLAWLYVYGVFPPKLLDHVNRKPDDNRIANLRLATEAENQYNRRIPRNNTSGFAGVSWDKVNRKWLARIAFHGKTKNLGRFDTVENALAARTEAEKKYHRIGHKE